MDPPSLLDPLIAEGHPIKIFGEDNVFKRITINKGMRPAMESLSRAPIPSVIRSSCTSNLKA